MTITDLIDYANKHDLDLDQTELHVVKPWGEIRLLVPIEKEELDPDDPALAEWPEGPALVLEAEQL